MADELKKGYPLAICTILGDVFGTVKVEVVLPQGALILPFMDAVHGALEGLVEGSYDRGEGDEGGGDDAPPVDSSVKPVESAEKKKVVH